MNSLIVFLLDKSSSMSGAWPAVCEGYNQFLSYQQMRMDDCHMVFAAFNTGWQVVQDFTSVFELPKLTAGDVVPQGGTELWAAVNRTFKHVDQHLADLPQDEQPSQVMFVIQSDGGDNNQDQEARRNAVRNVANATAKGWHFLWLADGNDAAKAAGIVSIPQVLRYQTRQSTDAFGEAGRRVLEAAVTGDYESLGATL